MLYGTNDEFSKLQVVVMCSPVNFEIIRPINIVQEKWHKLGQGPDPIKRVKQYKAVKSAIKSSNVIIWEINASKKYSYQVFARDTGLITSHGAFIGEFKFDIRKGEEKEVMELLNRRGVDINYKFNVPAVFEGGDFIFLNSDHAAIGLGERTNWESFSKLKTLLPDINLYPVLLPKTYLHLDVVFNVISPGIALAYTPALPHEFLAFLEKLDLQIIEISDEEQKTMATNVLAIGDNRVISASCNKNSNEGMRKEGLEVLEIDMSEILKGGGGPRCMTLPVFRSNNYRDLKTYLKGGQEDKG